MADGKPGRPATGQTQVRTARIGAVWERAEELALELARRAGTVSIRKGKEHGNVSAYVEEAIRRENARVERRIREEHATPTA